MRKEWVSRGRFGFADARLISRASVRYGFAELGLRRIIGLASCQRTLPRRGVLEKAALRYAQTAAFSGHHFSKYIIDRRLMDSRRPTAASSPKFQERRSNARKEKEQ